MLISCRKEKRIANKINGDWSITTLKRTDHEGLIEFAQCSGTLHFNKLEGDSANYEFQIYYEFLGETGTINQKGTYKLIEKGDFMNLSVLDINNNLVSYTKYRLLTVTSSDLELEFSDGIKTLIFIMTSK